MTSPQVSRYQMANVEEAPDHPGIYAWYAQFQTGPKDWESESEDGVDATTARFITILRDFAGIHEVPPMQISGDERYRTQWAGRMRLLTNVDAYLIAGDESSGDDEEAKKRRAVHRVVTSPSKRQSVSEILGSAAPVFSSPLYIGIARQSLRTRLSRHRADYSSAVERIKQDSAARTKLSERASKFGYRAAASGASMEQLCAWTLQLRRADLEYDEDIIRASEWYLQQLFMPVLGRL